MQNKKSMDVRTIVAIGLMAALVFIFSKFRIDIPSPLGKTGIHFGNIMCLLGGLLFGAVPGGLAAGIGSALLDLTDPVYAPEFWITFLTKFAMGFVAGWLGRQAALQGRRVLVAWMRMPQPVPASADGRGVWNGMMCLPRVLSEEKGQLYARPHPNLEKAYCRPVQPGDVDNTRPYRLRATLAEGEQLDIGGYRIWVEQGCLHTDRSRVFAGCQGYRLQAATPALEQPRCRLDIFVEPNLVEIFVDEGRFVLSSVVYGLEKYLEGTTIESVYAADPESPRDRSES